MSDSLGRPGDQRRLNREGRGASSTTTEVGDSFAELRSLLIGPEQRELLELQSHLFDPSVQTHDVSRVLPDAFALVARDPRLGRTLAPLIEESITTSVRKDPQPLADALFPVIGPAIRKAIGHALAAMMDSFSRSIEHSVSWRALQWRWTAWKTGRPFGEIVLLNTLQYRVEQVFLIHRETGLLLRHVSREHGSHSDADQVSAMLTAIQDFVRDSFHVGADESLDAMKVGELTVIVERGPYAVVAGVVRGTVPPAVRGLLQEALEATHRQLGPELRSFQGEAKPFERAQPLLEACLVTEFRQAPQRASWRSWAIAAAILLAIAAVWGFFTIRERQRWAAYLQRLSAEPGIVVVSSGRRDGKFVVAGLRDPLATDPSALLAGSGISPDLIESRWEPYQALHPPFVTARAVDLLRPPSGVTVTYRDGLLTTNGPAPGRWIADSERIAPAIAGVRTFEHTGPDPAVSLKERIEQLSILFAKGTPSLAAGQVRELAALDDLLRELNETARARGLRISIEIRGHTDMDGSDVLNGPLSEARAAALVARLDALRLDALEFSARGVGSTQPTVTAVTESEKQRNRRASLHVVLPENSSQRSQRP